MLGACLICLLPENQGFKNYGVRLNQSLSSSTKAVQVASIEEQIELIHPMGQTLEERFHLPKGCKD